MSAVQLARPILLAGLVPLLAAGGVFGQDFPNKPIRIVTPGTGGSSDVVARLIAQELTVSLGQPLIIDNRPAGVIPGEIVSKAPADGYTLLFTGTTFTVGSLMQKTPYDPVKDFLPITLAAISPNLLVVHPSLPVKSVSELIALAKARPGALNYSSGGAGSASQLAAELFNFMAGVRIQGIPYSSGSSRMAALVGGEVQLEFATAGAVAPHVQAGRLRALAVTTAQPSALRPGLPTVASSGLPGYESAAIFGMFAPAKTPDAIVDRLNREVVRVIRGPDIKVKLLNTGMEPVGSTPQDYANQIKAELARMSKVIKAVGIHIE